MLVGCASLESQYQHDMDIIRKNDAVLIARLVSEYSKKEHKVPYYDLAQKQPVMVVIAQSEKEENLYIKDPRVNKGAKIVLLKDFKAELERVLEKKVEIPRDPQKVATFAPNIYVYFVAEKQFCSAANLYSSAERTVPYSWNGGVYHSFALCYEPIE